MEGPQIIKSRITLQSGYPTFEDTSKGNDILSKNDLYVDVNYSIIHYGLDMEPKYPLVEE